MTAPAPELLQGLVERAGRPDFPAFETQLRLRELRAVRSACAGRSRSAMGTAPGGRAFDQFVRKARSQLQGTVRRVA